MSSNSNFCVDLIDLEALAERYHVFAIGFIEDAVKGIVNEKPLSSVFYAERAGGASDLGFECGGPVMSPAQASRDGRSQIFSP
jgi:hypothetical protein